MKYKILYITTDWNTPHRIKTGEYGGIGYYRAHGPAKALRAKGHQVDVLGKDLEEHVDEKNVLGSYMRLVKPYDVVVLKQTDTANVANLIGACKEVKIPIVMDLDDLITKVDPDNPAVEQGYAQGGAKQAFAVAALSMVDGLFVSTDPLRKEYDRFLSRKLQKHLPIHVLPNCIDPTMWKKQKKGSNDSILLGWHGSITHDADLQIIFPAVKKLMAKYDNLGLSLTGGVRYDTYENVIKPFFGKEYEDRIILGQGTPSYKGFPGMLATHSWDIGLIPLRNTPFARAKSHIKWLENSLLGVPSVISDVYPYTQPIQGTDVVVNNKTGILSKDDEWEEKIEFLINNPDRRKYIARDARNFVIDEWNYSNHIHKWEEAFASVIEEGSKSLRT